MLVEIEEEIANIIKETITDFPHQNIFVNTKPTTNPSITLINLKFKFNHSELSEDFDEGRTELEENFDSDGLKKSFKVQEKPLRNSVSVEAPPNVLLNENDYTVNYDGPTIDFRKAPAKGKQIIVIRYLSPKNIMTLKSLKLKALYQIDVAGKDRAETDSLTEKVITTLLTAETQLLAKGIGIQPVGGITLSCEKENIAIIQLRYIFEKEMQVKQAVGVMESIEIKSKKPSGMN